jgi:hypothetical protein
MTSDVKRLANLFETIQEIFLLQSNPTMSATTASVGVNRLAQRGLHLYRAKLAALVASRPSVKPRIENNAPDAVDLSTNLERAKKQFTKLGARLDERQPEHKPATHTNEVKTVSIGCAAFARLFDEFGFFQGSHC